MKNYKKYFINKLLDSYEHSSIYSSKNLKQKNIYFKFNEKNIQEYYDETEFTYKENIDISCTQLEQEHFIKIIKGKGYESHLINKLQLNLDNIQNAYKFIDRTPKNTKENNIKILLDKYKGYNKCLDDFIEFIIIKLDDNKSIKKYLDIDNLKECNDILIGLKEALNLKEETFKRNFSIRVYGDSKRYEHIENKVIKIIRDFEEDSLINEYNIIGNYTYVYFKGNITFDIINSAISGNSFEGGIAISSKDIDKIKNIKINSEKLFTIENLTTFNNFNKEGAVIYLGGYHNKVRRDLLKKIYDANPQISYYHFGDIDAGGFKILNHLRRKTKINFKPYMMDVKTLNKYINYAKDLTNNDKIEINRLLDNDSFYEFKDVLQNMLFLNKKLEQEIYYLL